MKAVADWLFTYAVHSTLLLGIATVVTGRIRMEIWREAIWKAAVVGSVCSVVLGQLLAVESSGGEPDTRLFPAPSIILDRGSTSVQRETAGDAPVLEETGRDAMRLATRERIGLLWLLIAGGLVTLQVVLEVRLRVQLRRREELSEGPLASMVRDLWKRAGIERPVRLSCSPRCPTPVALATNEICVPQRFACELTPAQQRSALAHELAHLHRRDPHWFFALHLLQALFFFQPLLRLARVRLRASAELQCDDWAARQTGTPLELAHTLTVIAGWILPVEPSPGTLTLTERGTPLTRRVERLVHWRPEPIPHAGPRRLMFTLVISLAGLVMPVVGQRTGMVGGVAAQEPVIENVLRPPGALTTLRERYDWAVRADARAPLWIGWSAPRSVHRRANAPSNASGTGLNLELSDERLAVLFRWTASPATGSPDDMRFVEGAARPRLRGATLVWLGSASSDESIALLEQIAAGAGHAVRIELASVLALHDGAVRSIQAATVIASGDADAEVRAEAVQWLPRGQQGPAVVRALSELIEAETDPAVRAEVAHALGASADGSAVPVLVRVAERDPAQSVRIESVDALRTLLHGGVRAAGDALRGLGDRHTDPEVRSEALQALIRHAAARQ